MKVGRTKRGATCCRCEGIIEKGELYVVTTIQNQSTGYIRRWFYHPDCYIDYIKERIADWEAYHPARLPRGMSEKKRRRNEIQTVDRERRRRLMALYRYHRKRGNIRRMAQVEDEIRELSYGESPYHDIISVY